MRTPIAILVAIGMIIVVPFSLAAHRALAVAAPVESGLNEIKSDWVT